MQAHGQIVVLLQATRIVSQTGPQVGLLQGQFPLILLPGYSSCTAVGCYTDNQYCNMVVTSNAQAAIAACKHARRSSLLSLSRLLLHDGVSAQVL